MTMRTIVSSLCATVGTWAKIMDSVDGKMLPKEVCS